jgi:hypothetical protein
LCADRVGGELLAGRVRLLVGHGGTPRSGGGARAVDSATPARQLPSRARRRTPNCATPSTSGSAARAERSLPHDERHL